MDIVYPGATPKVVLGTTKLPDNVDLFIWQGDAQRYALTLTGAGNVAVDLSGQTATAVIRENYAAPTSYAFQCTISGNVVSLYMSSTVTKAMPAGSYVWNLQVADNTTGDVRTYMAGDVTVLPEVDG